MVYDSYYNFIAKLRRSTGDTEKLAYETTDGDGSTKIFPLKNRKIKPNSYTVKVDGSIKTEGTDYLMDTELGVITFTTPPPAGSDNVEVEYRYYHQRDSDFMEMIRDAFYFCRLKLWKEVIDTTTYTTIKDQYEYTMPNNCIDVISLYFRKTSNDNWIDPSAYPTNWSYLQQSNKLLINPPFSVSGYQMKIRYLRSFYTDVMAISTTLNGNIDENATTITVSSTTGFDKNGGTIQIDNEQITYTGLTSTSFTGCIRGVNGTTATSHTNNSTVYSIIDCPVEWLMPIEYFVKSYWYERLANEKLFETGIITSTGTYEPLASIINLANYYRTLAEKELAIIRPKLPAKTIPIAKEGKV